MGGPTVQVASTSPAPTVQPRHAVRGLGGAESGPSPARVETVRRAASPPYPPHPRQLPPPPKPSTVAPPAVIDPKVHVPYQAQASAQPSHPRWYSPTKRSHELDLVSLPPVSELDRIAGSYGAYHYRPSNLTFAERRRSDTSRRTLVSEEDVRHVRLALLEGRRWILSMLEETTELLTALEEVPQRERQREESRYDDVRMR